jgi:NAD(P) transhydrogenase subunit alpha
MRIGIPAEIRTGETRVAATPETVKKLAAGGKHQLLVQAGAGDGAAIPDAEFTAAGATIVGAAGEIYSQADIVLKVRGPDTSELPQVKRGSILAGLLNPYDAAGIETLAKTGVTGFAMEWLPRITRAQSMDVLSSQANIAATRR